MNAITFIQLHVFMSVFHYFSDLKKFCVDTYANYVIQKLIESATDRQLEEFRLKLRPYYYEITRHVCGRKIIDKLRERGYAM